MEINLAELKKLIQETKNFLLYEKSISKLKYPFKALFIFGPAGSGKTTVKDEGLQVPSEFTSINPDDLVEEVFPKFGLSLDFSEGPLEVKQQVRKILQQATMNKAGRTINKGKPIIVDTTGDEPKAMIARIRALVDIGYDVAIFHVNVSPDFSVISDYHRGQEGGRTVGAAITRDIANKYQQNVAHQGAYFYLADERGITLLSDGIYPNIFDLRTGELRSGVDPSILTQPTLSLQDPNGEEPSVSIPNPFKGVTPDSAKKLLDNSKEKMQKWLNAGSENKPENAIGATIYDALSNIERDEITDIAEYIADEYGKEKIHSLSDIPDIVREAAYLTGYIEETEQMQSALPSPKQDPETGIQYTEPGATTVRQLTGVKGEVSETVDLNYLKQLIQEIKKQIS